MTSLYRKPVEHGIAITYNACSLPFSIDDRNLTDPVSLFTGRFRPLKPAVDSNACLHSQYWVCRCRIVSFSHPYFVTGVGSTNCSLKWTSIAPR